MASSDQSVNVSRKIVRLGIFIVAACVIYTAAWYFATNKVQNWLQDAMQSGRGSGYQIECPGLELKGFPFRVGLFCDSMTMQGHAYGAGLSTGAIRSAAQVYDPGHAVFEIDGPALLQPSVGLFGEFDWSLFHGSVIANLDGVDRMSIETNDATAALSSSFTNHRADVEVGQGALHVRQFSGDLDVVASASNAKVDTTLLRHQLPRFSATVDLTLAKLGGLLNGKRFAGGPVEGQMRRLALDFASQGSLAITGPFTISQDGYLSGEFDVQVEDFDALAAVLSASFPQSESTIMASRQLVADLSPDGKRGRVRVTVSSGTILLGVIPVGFIPPI